MESRTIIDCHTHIFPEKIADKAVDNISKFYSLDMSYGGISEDLRKKGQKNGVKKYVIMSVATTPKQVQDINNFLAAEQNKHEEFYAFMTLHPEMENLEAEFERGLSLGLNGVKIHSDFQNFNLDSEKSLHLFKTVGNRCPIYVHLGDERKDTSSPIRMAKVLDECPECTIIGAHLGGYMMWDLAQEYLYGRDNIYFDTSSSLAFIPKDEAVQMIRKHGADKILFGTDYPMWEYGEEINRFLSLDLTEEERELILHKNTKRLLNL